MADSALLGRPLWYELVTTDLDAAERFYSTVVGWTVKASVGSPVPYREFHRPDGVAVAGATTIPAGTNMAPNWTMHVGVEQLEAGVARVEGLGGHAVAPAIEMPPVGRFRAMSDPQGAVFWLYEPTSTPRPELEPTLGDVSWHELFATDAEAAMRFYQEMFGWQATGAMDMGPDGTYHMFGRSFPLGGMMRKPAAMAQTPPFWSFYFHVTDVHEGMARVKANGGQILTGPMEVPGGDWVVICLDPQGAAFSLHHRKK